MLVGEPGIADMVAELHSVGTDGIEIGAIRYAREAFQKHRIQPVPIARRARIYVPGQPYHIVQRGNYRDACFKLKGSE